LNISPKIVHCSLFNVHFSSAVNRIQPQKGKSA
jgi:hypothetical protein